MEQLLQLLIYLAILVIVLLGNILARKRVPVPPPEDEKQSEDKDIFDIIFESAPEDEKDEEEIKEEEKGSVQSQPVVITTQQEQLQGQEYKYQPLLEEFEKIKKEPIKEAITIEPVYIRKPFTPIKNITFNKEEILQMVVGQIIFGKPKCKTFLRGRG